jgi:hypothetical protein
MEKTAQREAVSSVLAKYYSGNQIKMILARHVARMEKRRDAYRILVRRREARGPLGRPRRR